MIATMPASVLVRNAPWRTGVSGTIWSGKVGVAGGSRVEWHWAPLRSLTSLGFAVDWRATGSDTDLGGRAVIHPSSVALDSVSGSADASLLAAIQPDLPFFCNLTMQVEFPQLRLGGSDQAVEGTLATDAGSCTGKTAGAAPSAVAPMMLIAEKIGTQSRMRLVPATQRLRTLMTFVLSETGTLDMTMTREGAAALPFVGLPAGASVRGEI